MAVSVFSYIESFAKGHKIWEIFGLWM